MTRPRSKIKFRHKTEFRRRPPPSPLPRPAWGIEFDPGSYSRLSPESVITDPPLASRISPPALSPYSPGKGQRSVAPKRNQEERRERCTARRVHCSSEPGGVRASRERSPPRRPAATEVRARESGNRSDDSNGLLALPAKQRCGVSNGTGCAILPPSRSSPSSQRKFIPERSDIRARRRRSETRRETPAAVSVTTPLVPLAGNGSRLVVGARR